MADEFGRWLRELSRAENRTPLDALSEILAEARSDLAASDEGPGRPRQGTRDWHRLLEAEVAVLRNGLPPLPAFAAGDGAAHPGGDSRGIAPPAGRVRSDSGRPGPARIIAATSGIRRRLLAGGDPWEILDEAEEVWAHVEGVPGAEGFAACLAGFAALAASVAGDETALAFNLERSLRARELARPGFVASGSDLMRSWAVIADSGRYRIEGGTEVQQAEVSATPLFRRFRGQARDRGLRLGFGGPGSLTAHEVRLLRLVSDGRTSREIGLRLKVSPRTVEAQLEHIRAALGTTTLSAALRVHGETAATVDPGCAVVLTERERQIAGLVAQGWRNNAISERLGVCVKTVEKHLSTALSKTGSRNRVALASWWSARNP